MVVTCNYRLAWVLLVGAVLFGLLFAFSLVLDAVRGGQVYWYFALWLVFMIIWTGSVHRQRQMASTGGVERSRVS